MDGVLSSHAACPPPLASRTPSVPARPTLPAGLTVNLPAVSSTRSAVCSGAAQTSGAHRGIVAELTASASSLADSPEKPPLAPRAERPPAIPPRRPIPPELPPRPIPERQPLLTSLAAPVTKRGVPNDYVEDTSIPRCSSSSVSSTPSVTKVTTKGVHGDGPASGSARIPKRVPTSPLPGAGAQKPFSSKADAIATLNGRLPRIREDLINKGSGSSAVTSQAKPVTSGEEPWLLRSDVVASTKSSSSVSSSAVSRARETTHFDCRLVSTGNLDSHIEVLPERPSSKPTSSRATSLPPSSSAVDSAKLVLLPTKASERRYGSQRSTSGLQTAVSPSGNRKPRSTSATRSSKHACSAAARERSAGHVSPASEAGQVDADGYPIKRKKKPVMCPECRRCTCGSCTDPRRPLPFDDGCVTCIDYASCMCVPRRIFSRQRRCCCSRDADESCESRHRRRRGDCEEDSDDEDPCSCGECNARCAGRWSVLAALAVCLPCLCLYPLLRGARKGATACYNGCRRKCRCRAPPPLVARDNVPVAAPPKWKEAPL